MILAKRLICIVIVALVIPGVVFAVDLSTPLNTIKSTIDEVVTVVEKLQGDTNTQTRRGKIKEVLNPRFDFAEMAKRSLGANWSTISAKNQADFVDAFSKLLSDTYISRVENVKAWND